MNCIEIEKFSFRYPESGKLALKNIDMEVEDGSFVVLCGKSGCGKSTLLRQLKTSLVPHGEKTGIIRYMGRNLVSLDKRTQSAEIGYVLQNPDNQIVTDKVWHELAFGLESLGYDTPTIRLRVAEMASYFGIHEWFLKKVSELSGGQKQLLNLASVMAMHPGLLILDEPTSQLDPIAASDFLETIRKINRDVGTTVILTEHRLEDVIPWADQVYVMDEGEIIAHGKPGDIGKKLKNMSHDMFLSMPTPMQIYAETESSLDCPLTVSQGRKWMQAEMECRHTGLSDQQENSGEKKKSVRDRFSCLVNPDREIPEIRLKDVWFRYEKESPDVVKGLSLDVKKGEIYALVGGNGTGKSTAMSLIARIRYPYRGKIWLEGKEIGKYTDDELYHGFLGVLPQNPQSLFVKKTVRDDLYEMIDGKKEKKSSAYPIDMAKKDAVAGIAALTKLENLMDRHPYDLSGGEQQRLALAKILLLRPRILLMDEPTKGIDNHFKKELGEILRTLVKRGVTVLMISHDVEFCAQYADRTGLFFQGNVVTSKDSKEFFAGNSFYTTAANRMARRYFPEAVTVDDVVEKLKKRGGSRGC
ncbi:MAG: ATP-binding cassette domain-containing protein [Lachnospiraceae bacterium]|nr:ATP-binding cassette domain-containing protein [Lachnospiraceae bacterium]